MTTQILTTNECRSVSKAQCWHRVDAHSTAVAYFCTLPFTKLNLKSEIWILFLNSRERPSTTLKVCTRSEPLEMMVTVASDSGFVLFLCDISARQSLGREDVRRRLHQGGQGGIIGSAPPLSRMFVQRPKDTPPRTKMAQSSRRTNGEWRCSRLPR